MNIQPVANDPAAAFQANQTAAPQNAQDQAPQTERQVNMTAEGDTYTPAANQGMAAEPPAPAEDNAPTGGGALAETTAAAPANGANPAPEPAAQAREQRLTEQATEQTAEQNTAATREGVQNNPTLDMMA